MRATHHGETDLRFGFPGGDLGLDYSPGRRANENALRSSTRRLQSGSAFDVQRERVIRGKPAVVLSTTVGSQVLERTQRFASSWIAGRRRAVIARAMLLKTSRHRAEAGRQQFEARSLS